MLPQRFSTFRIPRLYPPPAESIRPHDSQVVATKSSLSRPPDCMNRTHHCYLSTPSESPSHTMETWPLKGHNPSYTSIILPPTRSLVLQRIPNTSPLFSTFHSVSQCSRPTLRHHIPPSLRTSHSSHSPLNYFPREGRPCAHRLPSPLP